MGTLLEALQRHFSMRQRANEIARSALQKPYKTLRVCRKIAFGAFAQHRNMTKKTTKPQCGGFAKRADHEKHAKIPSQVSPGSILEGFGASSGTPWAAVGLLLDGLGRLLDALGCLFGASWASLGRSWASLGCHMLPTIGSGSIFHRFWTSPGPPWSSPRVVFD